MSDDDKKILELYLKYCRNRKIIISIIIIFFFICTFLGCKYHNKNYLENNISNQEKTNSSFNESIENTTNFELIFENETTIQNEKNSVVEEKIEHSSLENTELKIQENKTKENISSNKPTKDTSKNKPANKDFLFVDGYTMANVTQAAQKYLESYNCSGECIPLKDAEGIYIGMRVVFY